MRIARFDYTPSNRLRLVLRGGSPHRASEWADLPNQPLESRLAEIAQEVDLCGEAAERKRRADQQAREAQQKRWEAAMQEARTEYAHAYRVKHFEEQTDAWHQAKRLTEYITAVRDHTTSLPPGQERTEIEAWLTFADAHLHLLTESATAPKLPTPPSPAATTSSPSSATGAPTDPAPTKK